MTEQRELSRRGFLKVAGLAAAGLFLKGCDFPDSRGLTQQKLELYRGDLQFVRTELKDVAREIVKPIITEIKPKGSLFVGDSEYIGWDIMPNKQGVNLYNINILGEGNLPYTYGVRISREIPETGSITLTSVRAHKGYSLVFEDQPTQRILHASSKDPMLFPETPFDDKQLRLGQPVYRGVTMDFSYPNLPRLSLDRLEAVILRSELGVDPEQYAESAGKRRYTMLNAAKEVIEESVKLPEGTRWIPELEFNGWEAFGQLPNGDKLHIDFRAHDWRERGYRGTNASLYIVDASSNFLPEGVLDRTFEEAAKRRIEAMDIGNTERQKHGWTPYPATYELNKMKQELGL